MCKLQRLLEHKLPIMTQRYAHHYPERLWDGVGILDQLARGRTNLARVVGSQKWLQGPADQNSAGRRSPAVLQ